MENKEKNETQNRREFFKEAARKALPILGAVALMSNPVIAKTIQLESTSCERGCSANCADSCYRDCTNSCRGTCKDGCKGGCRDTCSTRCDGGCKGSSSR